MNTPGWAAWPVAALLGVLSILLLAGKGGFLIAGYNTAAKEKRGHFDEKRLCRVVGGGCAVLTVILGLGAFYGFAFPAPIRWLMPLGYLATVAAIAVLANTICRVKGA